jgi:hypothetical protein
LFGRQFEVSDLNKGKCFDVGEGVGGEYEEICGRRNSLGCGRQTLLCQFSDHGIEEFEARPEMAVDRGPVDAGRIGDELIGDIGDRACFEQLDNRLDEEFRGLSLGDLGRPFGSGAFGQRRNLARETALG